MDVGHRETAGIAGQIAEVASAVTLALHNAIETVNRPGAGVPSSTEAAQSIASAFAHVATLHVSRVYQQEMMLARLNGDSMEEVRFRLMEHLVETTRGMAAPTARGPGGKEFPVGALTRHYQEQIADAFSQAICSLSEIIHDHETLAELQEHFGAGVDIIFIDPDDLDADTGNLPPEVLAEARAHARRQPVAGDAA